MYTYAAGSKGTFVGARGLAGAYTSVAQARLNVTNYAMALAKDVPAAMAFLTQAATKFATAAAATQDATAAVLVREGESLYGKGHTAAHAAGVTLPLVTGQVTTQTAPTGPSVGTQVASGIASGLQSASNILAQIFTSGGTPVGGLPTPSSAGGVPYAPSSTGAQTSAVPAGGGLLDQPLGPLTLGQWGMIGGVGIVVYALTQRIVQLAVVGAAVAGGVWFLGQQRSMPGRRVGQA